MSNKKTLSGNKAKIENGPAPDEINPVSGQYKDYWVLSKQEIEKGFVRPVRDSYVHEKCGTETSMNKTIAETYARDPKFYNMTFCITCKQHLPVDQFKWTDSDEKVGS